MDQPAPGQPPGPGGPGQPPRHGRPASPRGRRRWRLRPFRLLLALLLVIALFYAGLGFWGASRLKKTPALSGRADTAGTTWLLVGSDSREGLSAEERRALRTGQAAGGRTDTIILLHKPAGGGAPTLVSLPRDSYVAIPGHGHNKLNAAFSFGGPKLLVDTVERSTGITIDHYVEVGFAGIVGVVDAVGGVRVCVPKAIKDAKSGLDVAKGCQTMDGKTSLAYIRARYFDPRGDLGRIQRQQQFLSALMGKVFSLGTVVNPVRQVELVKAGTAAVVVDNGTGAVDLAQLGRTFRTVTGGNGVETTVPISDPNYRVPGAGSTVLWDKTAAGTLFENLLAGRKISAPNAS